MTDLRELLKKNVKPASEMMWKNLDPKVTNVQLA